MSHSRKLKIGARIKSFPVKTVKQGG